jgi:hypothetical protein
VAPVNIFSETMRVTPQLDHWLAGGHPPSPFLLFILQTVLSTQQHCYAQYLLLRTKL